MEWLTEIKYSLMDWGWILTFPFFLFLFIAVLFLCIKIFNWKEGMRKTNTPPYYQSLFRQYLHILFHFHRESELCICPICFDFGSNRTHKWDGCVCSLCGERNFSYPLEEEEHLWDGCRCIRCGTNRYREHIFPKKARSDNCYCLKCGQHHNYVKSDESLGEHIISIERCIICGDKRIKYEEVSYGECVGCGQSLSGPWHPGYSEDEVRSGGLCRMCSGNWFR